MIYPSRLHARWQALDLRTRFIAGLAAALLLAGLATGLALGYPAIRLLQSDWARPLFVWAPFPKLPKILVLAAYGGLFGVGLLCIAVAIGLSDASPANLQKLRAAGARIKALRFRPRTAVVLLALCVLPLAWALIVRPFHVPNEFLSLPGQTIDKDGKVQDNLEYIRKHDLEQLSLPGPDGRFVAPLRISIRSAGAMASGRALAADSPEFYWVDAAASQLEIQRIQDAFDYQALLAISAPEDLPRLQQKFLDDMRRALAFSTRQYSAEEKDFLKRNRLELERALVLGRFFYHHNFIFQAAAALAADPATVQRSQYGKGLTEGFAAVLSKIPEPLRFNAYLVMLYASYPLYLALIVAVAAALGLRGWRLVAVAGATVFSYLMTDVETVRLGVGLAPWRHLFDVLVLLTLYRLVRRPGLGNFMLLVLATLTGVYCSREMGLFTGVAAAGALLACALMQRSRLGGVYAVLLLLLTLAAWPLSDPRAQLPMSVVLLGVNTPGLPYGSLFVQVSAGVACVMFGLWLWLARHLGEGEERLRWLPAWALAGAAILYAAASGIYLMFYPRPHHFAPYFPVIALGAAVGWDFLRKATRGKPAGRWVDPAGVGLIAAILVGVLLLGAQQALEVAREEREFQRHPTHAWNFPAAQLTSTADPRLLQESVAMIRAREKSVSVNILSPWEAVLLPMAGKGKSGPFVLSFDSLVTETEVLRLRDHLLRQDAGVLFVDTRLIAGAYESPLPKQAYLSDRVYASVLRVRAHAMLRDVFSRIAPCYRLEERGPLISTYVRVPGTCR